MSTEGEVQKEAIPVKRKADELADGDSDDDDTKGDAKHASKKTKRAGPKRLVAVFFAYNGSGYQGLQIQRVGHTIEKVLEEAMWKAGAISDDNHERLQKIKWSRCARTDKGVHAAGNIISVKLVIDPSDTFCERVNRFLPPRMELLHIERVSGAFNAKIQATGRVYEYVVPTFAFHAGDEKFDFEQAKQYRIDDQTKERVNRLLGRYKGTLNFHNFTERRKPEDSSCKRYIINFSIADTFVFDGVEFARLVVQGMSFMIYQIRKMVGLVIAIARGQMPENTFDTVYNLDKVRVPVAPALGLLLDRCLFHGYDVKIKRARDGRKTFEEIYSNIESRRMAFKQANIYDEICKKEMEEVSMWKWATEDLPKFMAAPFLAQQRAAAAAEEGATAAATAIVEEGEGEAAAGDECEGGDISE